jgi:hypothetical protein
MVSGGVGFHPRSVVIASMAAFHLYRKQVA